ncbi:YtpI family protein [Metabacillus sp. 84]|uniref:YtpI family protein n=1 Tax=unclassified Metabacillus TaxID=2675274 RepID=UPI003CFB22C7
MPVLALIIFIAFVVYLSFKVTFFRSKRPMERAFISGKSSMALGFMVFFFGVNQFYLNRSSVSIAIGIVFVVIGAASIWTGYRTRSHFKPLAEKERADMQKRGPA